jgi:hypothetical protein
MQETPPRKNAFAQSGDEQRQTLPFRGRFVAPDVTLFNALNHYLIMDKGLDRADAFLGFRENWRTVFRLIWTPRISGYAIGDLVGWQVQKLERGGRSADALLLARQAAPGRAGI